MQKVKTCAKFLNLKRIAIKISTKRLLFSSKTFFRKKDVTGVSLVNYLTI